MTVPIQSPLIRFDFKIDYTPYKLKDITETVERPLKMKDNEFYSLVTVKRRNEGIVKRGEFLGKDIKVKNQYIVKSGDFLISKRQIIHGACEIVPETLDGSIVSNEYYVLHGKKDVLLNEYLNLLSKTPILKKYFALACVGVDIEKMLFRIEDWKSRTVLIPTLDEQRKIVTFFSLLNQKIKKQQEKIGQLELFKKGLSQKILSQEIRFKDVNGQNFPDWEETQLGEVAIITGGGTPATNKIEYWNGDIPWFIPSEISHSKYVSKSNRTISEEGVKNSSAKLLPAGTVLLTTRATLGEMAIASVPVTTNQGFQSLIPRDCIEGEFLYYLQDLIKVHCLNFSSGSTFLEISKSNLEKFTFMCPSISEQKKIISFLSTIDEKIEAEKNKLCYLEELKNGLTYQMFV